VNKEGRRAILDHMDKRASRGTIDLPPGLEIGRRDALARNELDKIVQRERI
jgi:hypothetical protein